MKRVLIANRGEIALRVVQACRNLGLESVAVYTDADKGSLHRLQADQAVKVGPSVTSLSYLNQKAIIHVAQSLNCDAIHPGYGFLSENPSFVHLCEAEGIQFIGPSACCVRMMGDKARARTKCKELNIPVVPGSQDAFEDVQTAMKALSSIEFPVLIKARGGGGGRGMRIVANEQQFFHEFMQASQEAEAAFSDSSLYLEKYLSRVRHVEVQILGDQQGQVIALGERDCTVQRRYQKLVEESPCPVLGEPLQKKLHQCAVRLGEAIGYVGAGTVEFVVTEDLQRAYFIEMNTRIQVEHPVTELLFGMNLIEAQLRLAMGVPVSAILDDQQPVGHAIEFRINAEDWEVGFQPSPGVIRTWRPPAGSGVRIDTHVYKSFQISPYYDSMVAKLIVHGHDRNHALARAENALESFQIEGIKTTIGFHCKLLQQPAFRSGNFHTKWVEEEFLTEN